VARLDNLPPGTPAAPEFLLAGSRWRLRRGLNIYSSPYSNGLATQAWAGRHLRLLNEPTCQGRRRVELEEDGYRGWLDPQDLLGLATSCAPYKTLLLDEFSISQRLGAVLRVVDRATIEAQHLGLPVDLTGLDPARAGGGQPLFGRAGDEHVDRIGQLLRLPAAIGVDLMGVVSVGLDHSCLWRGLSMRERRDHGRDAEQQPRS